MGKNMKLIPLPFKPAKPTSFSSSSWPWPTCADPKAFSFRAENTTMNSIFVTEELSEYIASSTESNSASESSRRHVLITELDKEDFDSADAIENVIRGVKSERLFFEPSETSSSILGQPNIISADKNKSITTSEDEVDINSKILVIEMETKDPFLEFKESMKEMVEAHGVDNLDGLEELLNCYLRVNGKCNHGYIIGAFVDLLVTHDDFDFRFSSVPSSSSFSSSDSQSTTCISQSPISASSLSSFSTSKCKSTTVASGVSSLEDEEASA
ncbi:Transcription repressor [Heracleum sosnowskyi]|uniref:Transcription repressor n=1 Tax=Heracleum sosnowskyi TaxID=360622 RepID=A0AAD8ISK6_9APIA|nr:Transcription repressor [Heracleum sosnowskyi]